LLNIVGMLASTRVRVGLATVLDDDRLGRKSLAEVAALGTDVRGVKLAGPDTHLVVVDAAGGQSSVVADRTAPDLEIPPFWSSRVLILSGLSAVASRLAAFCKAARRARRDGTVVVLDVVGSLRRWAGQDPRVISMVLREADVVRCSFLDLAMIGTAIATVRNAMRSSATLVINDDRGTSAIGTFGEVRVEAVRESLASGGFGEAYTAAICAEFARPRREVETPGARWNRILRYEVPRMAAAWPVTQ
jgi:fructokinase/2-dehydro-3-deoxygluconokinase